MNPYLSYSNSNVKKEDNISRRRMEICSMRMELMDIEKHQHKRYLQNLEYDWMACMDSYPYWDDESRLIYDSQNHDAEN